MTPNIGCADRMARVAVGLALLSMLFWVEGGLRWVGLIGLVPLATAAVRFCPLYAVLGWRTCGKDCGSGGCGCGH